MKVTVRLFASFREAAGWATRELEVAEGSTAGDVLAQLRRTALPVLPAGVRPLLAVNHEHVGPERALVEGDEVSVFPPVSGGSSPRPAIGPHPIDVRALAESVRHPGCGAVVTFEGVVRDRSGDMSVESIEYEAHVEMAAKVLAQVGRDVEERHPGTRVALAHRTGRLQVGEPSVVVAASAPHRREAFAACRLAIDRIKEVLPVWKQEHGPSGAVRWR